MLAPSFAGREFEFALLQDFLSEVDPCGERGEFHNWVYDGVMFSAPLRLEPGEVVHRETFVYADRVESVAVHR